ncbi:solute carrier family 22 member 18-like [Tubulanus polymorphus]|uniref:solute carrier family 22 member 18-like n=1 Tax=Tubulanus polymorphus TaxID=672921 RepID=UPI003DA5913F
MKLRSSGTANSEQQSNGEIRLREADDSAGPRQMMKDRVDLESSGHTPDEIRTIRILKWNVNPVVAVTHFNLFLYSCAFWIHLGVMPYLTKQLGVDPVMYGYLQTAFAIAQLAGGPLFGRFGDLFGSRTAFVIGFLASAASFFILGISYSIPLLFVSKLPSLFMHVMQGGQMVITDLSDPKDRTDALAKLGFSYGIGFAVGPLIGGFITNRYGSHTAAFAAGFISLLAVLNIYLFIPYVHKPHEKLHETHASGGQVFSPKKLMKLVSYPGIMLLLAIKFISAIPTGVFQATFALVSAQTFNLSPKENGYVLSYCGIIGMINQLIGVGYLNKKLKETTLLKLGSFVLIWSYLALSFVTDVWQLCLVLAPLVFGMTLAVVVIGSSLTKSVPETDTGAILGMNMAVNSLVRTFAPTMGGYMLQLYGYPSIGYLGAFTSSLVTIFLFFKFRD